MDKTVQIKFIRESDDSIFLVGSGSDWKFLKNGLTGFADINNTLSYSDNAIADGGRITAEHVGKVDRTIKFANTALEVNDIARKQAIAFFNVHDTFKVFYTVGDTTVWAVGKMYKFSCSSTADASARVDITLTLMFANPYWNSFDNFGKNIASQKPMIGFPYISNPAKGGTTGGIFDFAQQVTLFNDGAIDTYCEAIIQCQGGQIFNPRLLINGEYVRILDTLEDGDEIKIDFTAFPPTVKKNGVNFIGHCDRTSNFDGMIIKRGDNLIQYDADNGSSHMNVTVYYYKQYGAI